MSLRIRTRLAILTTLALGMLAMPMTSHAAKKDLADHRWQNRLVVVFAPSVGHPLAEAQTRALLDLKPCARARDVVVVGVYAVDVLIDGTPTTMYDSAGLRSHFGIDANDAVVLLVGKDGGVKLRRTAPISAQELFGLIDAMPMRMREAAAQEHDRNAVPEHC